MSSFYSDASLVLVPSGYKTSKVYSAKPTDGTGDLTFTRSNDTATRVGADGLIEKVRTNVVTYSQDFSDASWTKTALTISTSATANPVNGALTAQDAIPTAVSSSHRIFKLAGVVSAANTWSIFAKAKGYNFITIAENGNTSASVSFNLSTGAVSTQISAVGQIQSLGNGWYRCSMIHTTASTPRFDVYVSPTDSLASYTADGTSGVTLFGAQAEASDFGATPYIPTTTAAVSVGPVANVPRLDYLNSSCPKLQLEPSRTNIFPKSESSDTWSFTNMTRTGNHGIAPDGYQSADLLAPTTSGVVTFTSDSTTSSLTIGQPFVCSFFIKLNQSFNSNIGQNIIDLRLGGSAMWTRPTVRINLATGSVTEIQNASYLSSTNYGNGWFRITFGAIPTGTTNATQLQIPTGTTMDGGSFYIWGLQGEANATYATSYIPTLGAAVTRGADLTSKTGISSLIGQTEGTIFAEIEMVAGNGQIVILTSAPGNEVNRVQLYIDANRKIGFYRGDASVNIVSANAYAVGTTLKIAAVYKANDYALYVNGVSVGTDTSATAPVTPSVLYLGQYVDGSKTTTISAKQTLLFKTRLTNAQMQELTSL